MSTLNGAPASELWGDLNRMSRRVFFWNALNLTSKPGDFILEGDYKGTLSSK